MSSAHIDRYEPRKKSEIFLRFEMKFSIQESNNDARIVKIPTVQLQLHKVDTSSKLDKLQKL